MLHVAPVPQASAQLPPGQVVVQCAPVPQVNVQLPPGQAKLQFPPTPQLRVHPPASAQALVHDAPVAQLHGLPDTQPVELPESIEPPEPAEPTEPAESIELPESTDLPAPAPFAADAPAVPATPPEPPSADPPMPSDAASSIAPAAPPETPVSFEPALPATEYVPLAPSEALAPPPRPVAPVLSVVESSVRSAPARSNDSLVAHPMKHPRIRPTSFGGREGVMFPARSFAPRSGRGSLEASKLRAWCPRSSRPSLRVCALAPLNLLPGLSFRVVAAQ